MSGAQPGQNESIIFLKRNAGAAETLARVPWVQRWLASRHFRHAFAHSGQAKPLLVRARRQAAAVITQSPASAAHPAASHGMRAGIGMFYDVIQPFLTDAKQRRARLSLSAVRPNSPVEVTDNTAAFQLHFARQRTDGLRQHWSSG